MTRKFEFMLIFGYGILFLGGINASAATININTLVDEFNLTPNTNCSWREAVQSVNLQADFGGCIGGSYLTPDIINVLPGTINLLDNPQSYLQAGNPNTKNYPVNLSIESNEFVNPLLKTQPVSTKSVTINGDPNGLSVINQTINTYSNFVIRSHEVNINNITFRGGVNGLNYGEVQFLTPLRLSVDAPSTLTNVTVENAIKYGITRISSPTLTAPAISIANSLIQNNGAGINNDECVSSGQESLYITNSVIKNNKSLTFVAPASGIYNCGHAEIKNSQISGNGDSAGSQTVGGIYLNGGKDNTASILENNTIVENAGGTGVDSVGGLSVGTGRVVTILNIGGSPNYTVLPPVVNIRNNTISNNSGLAYNDLKSIANESIFTNNLVTNISPSIQTCLIAPVINVSLVQAGNVSSSSICAGFSVFDFDPINGFEPGGLNLNTNSRISAGSGGLGGKTKTYILKTASKATSAGVYNYCPATDQFGNNRLTKYSNDAELATSCEAGAYELSVLKPANVPTPSTNPISTITNILPRTGGLENFVLIYYIAFAMTIVAVITKMTRK
jgi:hypothetical protein